MSAQPQRPGQEMARRLAALFTDRLPLKAAALFFALVLWLVASAEQPSEQIVPIELELRLDSTLQLVGRPPRVSALVVGSARELLKLAASPPTIRRVVDASAPDTLTLALEPRDIEWPIGVDPNDLVVRDVQPRQITLRFVEQMRRRVPVRSQLRFRSENGYSIAGSPSVRPESVLVVGPRRLVARITSVPTVASDVLVRDGQTIEVPLDTADLGVSVQPATVRIDVPLVPDTLVALDEMRP